MTFKKWCDHVAECVGNIDDLLNDDDIREALKLWHSRGWSPSETAGALQDELAGIGHDEFGGAQHAR